jgi:hypothetical protein
MWCGAPLSLLSVCLSNKKQAAAVLCVSRALLDYLSLAEVQLITDNAHKADRKRPTAQALDHSALPLLVDNTKRQCIV